MMSSLRPTHFHTSEARPSTAARTEPRNKNTAIHAILVTGLLAMGAMSSRPAAVTGQVSYFTAQKSVSATFAGGNLTIASDNNSDSITISVEAGNVRINGVDPSNGILPAANVTGLIVQGNGGDDTVDLGAVNSTDFPNLTSITINGGPGIDKIMLFADAPSSLLLAGQLTWPGVSIDFGNVEDADIKVGVGGATLDASGLDATMTGLSRFALLGNAGNDTFRTIGLPIPQSVSGGTGADELVVDAMGLSVTQNDSTVFVGNHEPISHKFVETVTIDNASPVGVEEERFDEETIVTVSGTHELSSVYPNPFAGQTRIDLTLARAQEVNVVVYDILGRQVTSHDAGQLQPNRLHTFAIDGTRLRSGHYVYVVTGRYFRDTGVIVVAR